MTYVAPGPVRDEHGPTRRPPPVPYFGKFLETNIRLYSCDEAGRHGVLFRLGDQSTGDRPRDLGWDRDSPTPGPE